MRKVNYNFSKDIYFHNNPIKLINHRFYTTGEISQWNPMTIFNDFQHHWRDREL